MKWNSELKWSSLLQQCHKPGADKSRWKSFQSGPQFCHCSFSSALRKTGKTAHLAWKNDAFLSLTPWMVWLPIFHKVREWRSRAVALSAMTWARFSPELRGAVTEHRKAATSPGTRRDKQGPHNIWNYSSHSMAEYPEWKEPTSIMQPDSSENSP